MPKLRFRFLSYSVSSFHLFGILGFILGSGLGLFLTVQLQLSIWVLLGMVLIGGLQLILHTWIQKAITGRENLVYYRHEIGIIAFCAIFLWLFDQPVIVNLDICLLGIGTFLGFGRLGCFHVGCCHGKPCKFGVQYSLQHTKFGFPFYYFGVKIFPIQLVESFFVFITVIIGVYVILDGFPIGTVLVWYTVFYGSVRFILEFFRGDAERPYWKGFSEAQWTTVGLGLFTLILGKYQLLPIFPWQIISIIFLLVGMVFMLIFKRNFYIFSKLLAPNHVREIAIALKNSEKIKHNPLTEEISDISVSTTSLALNISSGTKITRGHQMVHYTLSCSNNEKDPKYLLRLDLTSAKAIGKLLSTIKHRECDFHLEKGRGEIYHIIFSQKI